MCVCLQCGVRSQVFNARELSEVTWRNWLEKGLGPARSRSCWETCNAKEPGKDTGKREHRAAREGCSTWERCLAGGIQL